MVESTALEMRHTRKGIEGSNPSLSATIRKSHDPSRTFGMSCVDGSRIARADVRFGVVVGCSLVFDLFARRFGRWP